MKKSAQVSDVDETRSITSLEPLLPRSAAIIEAFRRGKQAVVGDHPLLTVAAKLAEHHQQWWVAEENDGAGALPDRLPATTNRGNDSSAAQHLRLIDDIDAWTARRVPRRPKASLHDETLGVLLDRLAIAWVRSNRMIDLATPDDREMARLALRQLAGLAVAYDDLVRDVIVGNRRFPNGRVQENRRA